MSLGKRFKSILNDYNLNESQMAEELGVGRAAVNKIINGRSGISGPIAALLETKFKVNIRWLKEGGKRNHYEDVIGHTPGSWTMAQYADDNALTLEEYDELGIPGRIMYPLPKCFLEDRSHNQLFIIQVRGGMLTPVGIMDTDFVIVERLKSYANGELIVAKSGWNKDRFNEGGEFLFGRLYERNSGKIVEPPSQQYPLIEMSASIKIIGKIIGSFRKH